ncbi:MAG TPA: MarR family transcriptional regulator [Steroidobacteraceae bacterium]|nr:MarR family transcriptional regulator [Steroidobacteraceae bacterium]
MPAVRPNPAVQSTAGTSFEASPSFLIMALGNKLSVSAERNLRKTLDLSLMEWRVLAILAVEPAAPPGRIIAIAGVNKAAVSRAVNSLEQRKLLRRVAAANHGLRTHLFLTAAGLRLHRRGEGARMRAESQLLQGMTASERAQLITLLKKVMRNFDRADQAASA